MSGCEGGAVTEAADLEALAPVWWGLWRRCPAATPFQSPAWLIPWWRAFAPGRLAVATVHRAGRLVGLAPFYLEDGALGRRLLPVGIGVTDYLDVLIDPDAPAGTARRLVGAVGAAPDWERWELEELAPAALGHGLAASEGWTEDAAPQSACPVLALDPNVADALAGVPARQRRKLRMTQHRLARRGGEITDVPEANLPGFLAELFKLHEARWLSRGEAGVLADPRVRRFHEEALPKLAAQGMVRAHTLTIDGRVAGAYYGLQHAGRAYAYLGGFDPDFSFESPGTALLGHAIEAAHRDGATEFHLLRGQEPYKYEWGAKDRWNVRRSFGRTTTP